MKDLPELDIVYNLMSKMEQRFSEAYWLLQEIKKINPTKILEIGTAHGGTAALFATTGATVYTIDKVELPDYSWDEEWYRENYPDAKIIKIVGDSSSSEVIEKVKELAPFDFIFIDGDHTAGVWWDWGNYSRLGKFIGLHDIINHNDEPLKLWTKIKEVHPKTREIFCEKKTIWGGWWGYGHGGGIGIVEL